MWGGAMASRARGARPAHSRELRSRWCSTAITSFSSSKSRAVASRSMGGRSWRRDAFIRTLGARAAAVRAWQSSFLRASPSRHRGVAGFGSSVDRSADVRDFGARCRVERGGPGGARRIRAECFRTPRSMLVRACSARVRPLGGEVPARFSFAVAPIYSDASHPACGSREAIGVYFRDGGAARIWVLDRFWRERHETSDEGRCSMWLSRPGRRLRAPRRPRNFMPAKNETARFRGGLCDAAEVRTLKGTSRIESI